MSDGPAPPEVRAGVADDTDAVFALASSMALTYTVERTSFEESYRRVLDDPHAHLLVVDVAGEVGGYLLAFEHPAFFANGAVGWVEEIAVRAELRRRRLGALLMSSYERALRDRGGRLVALATTRAGPFYSALGYADHATYYRKRLV